MKKLNELKIKLAKQKVADRQPNVESPDELSFNGNMWYCDSLDPKKPTHYDFFNIKTNSNHMHEVISDQEVFNYLYKDLLVAEEAKEADRAQALDKLIHDLWPYSEGPNVKFDMMNHYLDNKK